MTIPRLSERIQCLHYRRRLELDIAEVRPDLNILRNAAHELHSSLRFKQTLQVGLSLRSNHLLTPPTDCSPAWQYFERFRLPWQRKRLPA